MRGLTIKQPWAWAIAVGAKRIENRSRPTSYRGPVAIHAGQAWAWKLSQEPDPRCWHLAKRYALHAEHQVVSLLTAMVPQGHIRGAIVAVGELTDCHLDVGCCRALWGDESWVDPEGMRHDVYHWRLAYVRPLNPVIPARGALGLWKPTPELLAAINEQRVAI